MGSIACEMKNINHFCDWAAAATLQPSAWRK
jgi:hypothetical protein